MCIFLGEIIFLWQLILKLSMFTSFHGVPAPMISLARFKNEKNIFFYFEKRHSFLEKII
jgi:hypothetical protein